MKKLSLFLVTLTMILFSCKPEIEKPTVATKSVGEITKTTATVSGDVTSDGGAEVTERGVCWNSDGAPTILDSRTKDGTGIGSFTSNLSDLTPQTTYYVRTYATNEAGTSYGEEKTFTTLADEPEQPGDEPEQPGDEPEQPGDEPEQPGDEPEQPGDEPEQPGDEPEQPEKPEDPKGLPVVITGEVNGIGLTYAYCDGEVISSGDAAVVARGVCWNTTGNPTFSDAYTTDGSNIGEFESKLENLVPNTQYYVRAYATSAKGTAYGEEVTFTTLAKLLPEVTTGEVTDITVSSANCGIEVTFDGNVEVISRGICWSTSQNPTIEDNFTSKLYYNGDYNSGDYFAKMTDLEHNTTYYVRAFATNEVGTAYGEEVSFTTVEKLLPTVITGEVTNITVSSAKCRGEVTSDGNGTVTAYGHCWSTTPNPTIEENDGTVGSGNIAKPFTSSMTNLEHNTTYYIRAYATNEIGTAYGEEVSFTTVAKLLPEVTTGEVTDITLNSAKCVSEVTFAGNVDIMECGVCWSTTTNPTIEDNKVEGYNINIIYNNGIGSWKVMMTDLEHNTTYYVRAYATNEIGTAYGEEVIFTTLPIEGTANGHSWVDLGLPSGKKWATCNVGATLPEEYGDYFAWGETNPKSEYTSNNNTTYDKTMNDISGNAQYDAARANWGGNWRIPTYDELYELGTKCTWTWTTQNGVNGYKVTGPSGASIFLPAAGVRYKSSLGNAGVDGFYWSSTPLESSGRGAYNLDVHSSNHGMYSNYRYYGLSVRPVIE